MDTTPPTIALASSKTSLLAGETATVTFTLSEPSTDFTLADVFVSGGTMVGFSGSGTSYSAVVAPAAGSVSAIVVSVPSGVFSDAAGNPNADGLEADNNLVISRTSTPPGGAVTISGTAALGQMLSASNTLIDPDGIPISGAGTLGYQWLADGVAIPGATTPGLILAAAQVGKAISVRAGYTDGLGTNESVTSAPYAVVTGAGSQAWSVAARSHFGFDPANDGAATEASASAPQVLVMGGNKLLVANALLRDYTGDPTVNGSEDVVYTFFDATTLERLGPYSVVVQPWSQVPNSMVAQTGHAFVVQTSQPVGYQSDIYGVFVDPLGTRGPQLPLMDLWSGADEYPALGQFSDGSMVVAWQSEAGNYDVKAQNLDAFGQPVGTPYVIAGGAGQQFTVDETVLTLPAGNQFVVLVDDQQAQATQLLLVNKVSRSVVSVATVSATAGDRVLTMVMTGSGTGAVVHASGSILYASPFTVSGSTLTLGTAFALWNMPSASAHLDVSLVEVPGNRVFAAIASTNGAQRQLASLEFDPQARAVTAAPLVLTNESSSAPGLPTWSEVDATASAGQVHIAWTDFANNTIDLFRMTDSVGPAIALSAAKAALRAGESTAVTFTLSESSTDFTLADITVTGGSLGSFSGAGASYTAVYTHAAGGTVPGAVSVASGRFSDGSGNLNTDGADANNQLTITRASTPPTGTVTIAGTNAPGQTLTASHTLTDVDGIPTSGPGAIQYQWLADGVAIAGATASTLVLTAAEAGKAITVRASYIDDLGTAESVVGSAAPDTIPPTLAIATTANSLRTGETATVTFTLSEPSIDFALADVSTTGGTLTGFAGVGSVYTATFSHTPGSTASGLISVAGGKFNDTAGNLNATASNTLVIARANSAPTGAVTITGSTTTGQTLTAAQTLADIDGIPTTGAGVLKYQWLLDGVAITGATTSTLLLAPTHVGKTIAVRASYTDNLGTPETVTSTATAPVTLRDTTPPTIALSASKASLLPGETSTITFALSEPSTDFVLADVTVTGGTLASFDGSGASYTAVYTHATTGTAAGVISVASTRFTDAAGNANADGSDVNNKLTIARTSTPPTGSVTITGTTTQGQTLTAAHTLADVDGIPTSGTGAIKYQWLADGVAIAGATASTLVLGLAQIGKAISVRASYTDNLGTAESMTSSATALVAARDSTPPTIALTASKNSLFPAETATVTFTLSEPATDFVLADVTVTGGTLASFSGSGTSYTAVYTHAATGTAPGVITVANGKFTDAAGNLNADGNDANNKLTITRGSTPPTGAVTISGTPTQGQTLTAAHTLSDIDGIPTSGTGVLKYQWLADGVAIANATAATLVLAQAQVGKAITVRASYTDNLGTAESVTSSATALVAARDSTPPTIALTASKSGLLAGETSTLTFTLSEPATDFALADVAVTGGTLASFEGSGMAYTAVFTHKAGVRDNGVISVASGKFADAAGNLNADGSDANNKLTITRLSTPPTGSVSISGTAMQGQTLKASHTLADADGIPTSGTGAIRYQWLADGAAITAATAATLLLAPTHVGKAISVRASYTDNLGTAEAVTSAATAPVALIDTVAPTIALSSTQASLKAGETATVLFTLGEPATDFELADVTVTGGTLSAFAGSGVSYTAVFTPTPGGLAPGVISVASGRFSDVAGNLNADGADANNTVTIARANSGATGYLTIVGSPELGKTLSIADSLADVDGIPASGAGAKQYRWLADGTPIDDATGPTLTLTEAHMGKAISVRASYTDGLGKVEAVSSSSTSPVWLRDVVAPTIAITTNRTALAAGETATLAFALSEPSTDFTPADIVVSGGTLSDFKGGYANYTAVFTPTVHSTAPGRVSVASGRFADAAGNLNADGGDADNTLTLTIDTSAAAPVTAWTKLLGTDTRDSAASVASAADGTVYVVGTNESVTGAGSGPGTQIAFLAAHQPDGTRLWTHPLGEGRGTAVALGNDGAVYAAGEAGGDAFVARHGGDGAPLWRRALATVGTDSAQGLAVGVDGAIYVAGYTQGALGAQAYGGGLYDAYVSRIDPDGTVAWTRQFGSAATDVAMAVVTAADGSIYLAGQVDAALDGQTARGGKDAFVAKYAADGTKVWTRQLGSAADDAAYGLAIGSDGAVYVAGAAAATIDGQPAAGGLDAFVARYSPDGTRAWTRSLGSSANDAALSVVRGADGAIYLAGSTDGALDGQTGSGAGEAFLAKFDAAGAKAWTKLLGTAATDVATALGPGGDGAIYMAGYTDGGLDGQVSGGGRDAFVSRWSLANPVSIAPGIALQTSKTTLRAGETATLTFTLTKPSPDFTADDIAVSGGALVGFAGAGRTFSATFVPTPGSTAGGLISVASGAFSDGAGRFNTDGADVDNRLTIPRVNAPPTGTVAIVGNAVQGQTLAIASTLADADGIPPSGPGALRYQWLVGGQVIDSAQSATLVVTSAMVGRSIAVRANYTDGFGTTESVLSAGTPVVWPLDGVPPTIALSSSRTSLIAGETATLTFTLSEPSADFMATDVSVSGGTLGGFQGSGTTYTATFTPLAGSKADGLISVASGRFTDAAGNRNVDGAEADNTVRIRVETAIAQPASVWTAPQGSAADERAAAVVTAPDGSVYTAGTTSASLDGQTARGGEDAYLSRFNPDGSLAWTRQMGTAAADGAVALALGPDGAIYVAGNTSGAALDGEATKGGQDAFLARYAADGTRVWTRVQGSSATDAARALAVTADGGIYLAGSTQGNLDGQIANGATGDAFVSRYAADGTRLWTRLLGGPAADEARALAAGPQGSVYVAGQTGGGLGADTAAASGGQDAFVARYGADGSRQWAQPFGSTASDAANAVTTTPDGSVYVAGSAGAALDGQPVTGSASPFLAKFGADGTKGWTSVLGASGSAQAVVATPEGALFVAGQADGALGGQTPRGAGDAFVARFEGSGTPVWSRLIGSESPDAASSLARAPDGSLYVAGTTGGGLDGQAGAGGSDAFLTRWLVTTPDASKPAIALGASAAWLRSGETATVSFTLSEPSSDFTQDDVVVTGGTLSGFAGWGTNYTATVALAPGPGPAAGVVVRVGSDAFSDAAGNRNADGADADNTVTLPLAAGIPGPASAWKQVQGTSANDWAAAVSRGVDGSIYVAGTTSGDLDGEPVHGGNDAYLTRYLPDGTRAWTRLLGSSLEDRALAVAAAADGSIYLAGDFHGNAFIARYTPEGMLSWMQTHLTGRLGGASALCLGPDGAVYLAGVSMVGLDGEAFGGGLYDAFVDRYGPDGSLAWTRTLGSSATDIALALAAGLDGAIYLAGHVNGELAGQANAGASDAFLTRFEPDGSRGWTRLLGSTGDDWAYDLAVGTDGAVYIGGFTGGSLGGQTPRGGTDAFVARYTADGTAGWVRQFGSAGQDIAMALAPGADGGIQVAGGAYGSVEGQRALGSADAFLASYDASGNLAWTSQFGTNAADFAMALAAGDDGSLYAAGFTEGSLDGRPASGGRDAFLVRWDPVGQIGQAPTLAGTAAADRFAGTAADDRYDGQGGIDTIRYAGARNQYAVSLRDGGIEIRDTVNDRDGRDLAVGVERLQFSDVRVAFDLDGAARDAALLLGLALGPSSLTDKSLAGAVLGYMDTGKTLADAIGLLHGAGVFASMAGAADNRSLLEMVYRNVHGSAAPAGSVGGLLASMETLGQAGFLREFAASPAAEAGIDLVGLRLTGLEYL